MHNLNKLYILLIFLSLNLFFFSTSNAYSKSFKINDIEVSKPFENKFNKNLVIDMGFNKAFFELMNSLIKSNDVSKVEKIKLNEIKTMIDSFSIKEEKFIDQTYFVNLGVSFNKKKIFSYLEQKNIFPSQIIKKDFLFIPIIIDENINELEIFSNNLIYNNWNKISEKYHLINYVLPTEDIEDLEIIKKNYDSIENYDFKKIIEKYLIDNCIITLIFKDGKKIRILSKIITKDKVVIKNKTFPEFNLKDKNKIEDLIKNLKLTFEDTWKEYNQINTSIKLPILIRVKNDDPNKLIQFEKTLEQLNLISFYLIKKFDRDYSFYEIVFNGTSINFINMMREYDYKFNTEKKIWTLK